MERRPAFALSAALLSALALPSFAQIDGGGLGVPAAPAAPQGRGEFPTAPSAQGRGGFPSTPAAPARPGRGFDVAPPLGPANGLGFGMPLAQTPELARKMKDILALREMLRLNLTERDLRNILPLLKELREADRKLERESTRTLDVERDALLEAWPGDDIAEARPLAALLGQHQNRLLSLWAEVARKLNSQAKYDGLVALLSGIPGQPPGMGGGGGLGGGSLGGGALGGGGREGGAFGGGDTPDVPDAPPTVESPDPNILPPAAAPPAGVEGQSVSTPVAEGGGQTAPAQRPQRPRPGTPSQPGVLPPGAGGLGGGDFGRGGFGGGGLGGGGFGRGIQTFPPVRVTFDELISLIEQKLATRRK